jgi:hypothetical protein
MLAVSPRPPLPLNNNYNSSLPSFLPLGATAQGELWPPKQSAFIPSLFFIFPPVPSLMSISLQSIHPRLIVWFMNNLVFTV